MAQTTLSTLANKISPIVQEAMFVASETAIMPGLVRTFTVPANSGKILQVPKFATTSAANVAEGTDLAGSSTDVAITPGKSDITIQEAGVMTVLTDMSRNYATGNVVADLGRLFGEAIAKRHDQALTGLFSGFSNSLGAPQDEVTVELLFKAFSTLKSNAVPGPYYGVFHPKAIYNVKKTLTNTFTNPNAGILQNEAMREGYVGRIAGIDIFETSNVVEDSATSVTNAVFSRDALGLAVGENIKIATQRDESLRAEEIVATTVYGVAELHDTYGVKIIGDNQL